MIYFKLTKPTIFPFSFEEFTCGPYTKNLIYLPKTKFTNKKKQSKRRRIPTLYKLLVLQKPLTENRNCKQNNLLFLSVSCSSYWI